MNKLLFYLMLFFLLWLIQPAHAQQVGITTPITGDILEGVVLVRGTATDPNFAHYQLFLIGDGPLNKNPLLIASGEQPVINDILYVWDTTIGQEVNSPIFPDGIYQLKLRVLRNDFKYDEYLVTELTIKNNTGSVATITPEPTKELPPVTTAPSPTPGQPTLAPITTTVDAVTLTPSPIVTPTGMPVVTATPFSTITQTTATTTTVELPPPPTQPAILPSLTPFPSPTPEAVVANQSFSPRITGAQEEKESSNNQAELIVTQLLQFDYGVFRRGFQQGFLWTFGLFGLLGSFLVLRGIFRWIRHAIFSNW